MLQWRRSPSRSRPAIGIGWRRAAAVRRRARPFGRELSRPPLISTRRNDFNIEYISVGRPRFELPPHNRRPVMPIVCAAGTLESASAPRRCQGQGHLPPQMPPRTDRHQHRRYRPLPGKPDAELWQRCPTYASTLTASLLTDTAKLAAGSSWWQADGPVEPDDLAIHVTVGHQFGCQRSKFVGEPKPLGKSSLAPSVALEGVGLFTLPVNRGVDESRRNGVHADTVECEIAAPWARSWRRLRPWPPNKGFARSGRRMRRRTRC